MAEKPKPKSPEYRGETEKERREESNIHIILENLKQRYAQGLTPLEIYTIDTIIAERIKGEEEEEEIGK